MLATSGDHDLAIDTAGCDPYCGYGRDGDEHWTPDLVRGWWVGLADQADRIDRARRTPEVMADPAKDALVAQARLEWLRHLRTDSTRDLRRYMFRLEHGRLPTPADVLPDL